MLLKLEGEGPLYTQVYATLRRQIIEGRFPPGKRLPGTRSIAQALGVSRTVILHAYAQLESEGYTTTRVGSGTYVVDVPPRDEGGPPPHVPAVQTGMPSHAPLPPEAPLSRLATRVRGAVPTDAPPRELLDDAVSVIDLTDAAVSYDVRGMKAWRQIVARAVDTMPAQTPGAAGARPLREAMLDYLHRERGVVANIDSAQQARDLIARVLVDEGTVVGVEDPCSPGVRRAFAAAGARLVACRTDADGLDIDDSAPALADARVVHVAPACHLPSGAVMPSARRETLLEWAYAHPAWVVEEDVDSDYRHGVRVMPSLASVDRHERVIYYMNGFTRTVYPALQVSCVVVPSTLRGKFHAIKEASDRDSMALRQQAWADYLSGGEYMRGLRRLSQQLSRKYQVLVEALQRHFGAAIRIQGRALAGQLLAHLPELDAEWATVLREEALRVGLLLQTATDWYLRPPAHATLLLHYAAVPESLLETAVERLAQAYRRAVVDVGSVARRRA